jgi:3-hydroxymyristoyl/3-hydroxydecanoyl-(acyl carrier protein) dehydratase
MTPDVMHIRRTGDDTAQIDIALSREHVAFAGHFPGRPILPGIVQLNWAVSLAADAFHMPYRPARRCQVKFVRAMTPDDAVTMLWLRLDRVRSQLTFEYRVGAMIASSGRAWLDP